MARTIEFRVISLHQAHSNRRNSSGIPSLSLSPVVITGSRTFYTCGREPDRSRVLRSSKGETETFRTSDDPSVPTSSPLKIVLPWIECPSKVEPSLEWVLHLSRIYLEQSRQLCHPRIRVVLHLDSKVNKIPCLDGDQTSQQETVCMRVSNG